jgi:hypothetical protein
MESLQNFKNSKLRLRTLEILKIYSGDIEEVWYDKMQIHAYTDGDGFEENE